MSHNYAVVAKRKARRLKAKVAAGGIATLSSVGGLAGFIELAVGGAQPWIVAPGIALSAVALVAGVITTPFAYDRYKDVQQLRRKQQKTAMTLNQFPDESNFMLEIAGIDQPQELHMTKLYKILERAHARAAVRFSEASSKIDAARSWLELSRIETEFHEINVLMSRIHEGYEYLTRRHLQGKRFTHHLTEWRRLIQFIAFDRRMDSVKQVVSKLYNNGDITLEDYDRLYITISHLESKVGSTPQKPSAYSQFVLDFELMEFEIEVYASKHLLESFYLEPSFILSNRPV